MLPFLLLPSFIKAVLVQITETNNTEGVLSIKTEEQSPHLTLVTFPKYVFPFLKDTPNYKIYKEGEDTVAIFYSESSLNLNLKYQKILLKIIDLDYKIERGFEFDPIRVIKKNGTVVRSNRVTDIFPVPDFSAPFIPFSTSGAVFGLIFNLFMNKGFDN